MYVQILFMEAIVPLRASRSNTVYPADLLTPQRAQGNLVLCALYRLCSRVPEIELVAGDRRYRFSAHPDFLRFQLTAGNVMNVRITA